MAIDANVAYVEVEEDGSGALHLCDRQSPDFSRKPGIAGQSRLHFQSAPYEVTALNGLPIWGSSGQILLGERKIADRLTYTRIAFVSDDAFKAAVACYHQRQRSAATGIEREQE